MIEHLFDLFRLELLADLAPEYASGKVSPAYESMGKVPGIQQGRQMRMETSKEACVVACNEYGYPTGVKCAVRTDRNL